MKTLYMVGAVKKTHPAAVMPHDIQVEIPLVWAEGMIGVLPVFETFEAADEYAHEGLRIYSMDVVEAKED